MIPLLMTINAVSFPVPFIIMLETVYPFPSSTPVNSDMGVQIPLLKLMSPVRIYLPAVLVVSAEISSSAVEIPM